MQNCTFILEDDQMMLMGHGISSYVNGSLEECSAFVEDHKGEHIFALISYDVKNEIENLTSNNASKVEFPDLLFVIPEKVVSIINGEIQFLKGRSDEHLIEKINQLQNSNLKGVKPIQRIDLSPSLSKQDYKQKVRDLKTHIQLGDIYEVTFCQEFSAQDVSINPFSTYKSLSSLTEAPFRCFVEFDSKFLLSGSPERFIRKEGNHIFSQPIKGTAKRNADQVEDQKSKESLLQSSKEKAENVMIVDLVRNDLSRIALRNSVKVDELFGVYSFKTVHQLISTISADLDENIEFKEIIKALFPMGSMTGAPKIKAMELIEKYEDFKRGLFSGSVGYIAPNGDFDFNVIIRSILYDQKRQTVACPVGGAITIQSDPDAEYEECLIKLEALNKALNLE